MRVRTLSLAVASAALLGPAVAGCSSSAGPTARPSTSTPPPTQTSTSSPESSPASPASSPATGTPLTLADRLLPTAQVPGLNAQWQWQDGETGPASTEPFGTCAKADLLSIGATDVVSRTYLPPDDSDDNAAQQVAEFPDAQTAATAWTVLKAWHDRCGRALGADAGLKVGAIQEVPVGSGSAGWYLLSWHPPAEETGRFEAFGMALDGTRITVVRIDHSGQDHSYPPGKDPVIGMVTAAASRLG
ncbi:MAG TPA: hypothetical protein VHO29_12465 [Marmoricola sp.]|nr:hypothetical protein [Marmoricola sp.]